MKSKQRGEKLTQFDKTCLVRWINSCNVWDTAITIENLPGELKNGVLLCAILKFHQPALDFKGLSVLSRTKQPCLNNLEMALSVMGQKGLPQRYMLTAEQIFEMQKVERMWLMIRSVFDVFAMHDVTLLKPKILNWLSSIITYYNPFRAQQQLLPVAMKTKEFYQYAQTGLPLFYIFHLYLKEPQLQPDPSQIFEYPRSKQEMLSNLSILVQIQFKINSPIYLTPQEFIDRYEPQYLMLLLYYLYVKFRHIRIESQLKQKLQFRDFGREPSIVEQHDESEVVSNEEEMQIIEEEDSLDFDSSRRSKNESFPQSASLLQPTPPRKGHSPFPVSSKEHTDLIIPSSKQTYNSRNANYQQSITDPGAQHHTGDNVMRVGTDEDIGRRVKAQTLPEPQYQLQMQHMGIFSHTEESPNHALTPIKSAGSEYQRERRMMYLEDLRQQLAGRGTITERQLALLTQTQRLSRVQSLLQKAYNPQIKLMSTNQAIAYLACPQRVTLSIQPRNSRQMHTIVAYLFLSFGGEDEYLIFKDTEMQVAQRVEWREIESIQMSQGKVMLYCKVVGKSQNQHDLGVKPMNAQTCELLCNALQNCYNRHFKRVAHQSLS